MPVVGRSTQGLSMAGPPSFEEARGGLVQQLAELITQRLGHVGVNRRGTETGMSEQDLDDADVDAALEQVRGEAVAERVRSKLAIKTALIACLEEGGTGRGLGQVGQQTPAGKEPAGAAVRLPDFAEHLQDGCGQR